MQVETAAVLGTASTRIVLPAQDLAVREGLRLLFSRAPLSRLAADDQGTAEIVLAEALNNIVEHAYAAYHGEIEVAIWHDGQLVHCTIVDAGLPMPDDTLPSGNPKPIAALPEGGFGWHLIRALTTNLHYRREGERNILSFNLEAQLSP